MDIIAINFISDTPGDLNDVKIPIVSVGWLFMHYFDLLDELG